ncbi:MAG: TetR/AcrR family transcriptional regulator [Gammaproteobacteria bacterium]|nr:TetR/AcrR family transcriptional regulator [Gammaproteobacteria bacterium]
MDHEQDLKQRIVDAALALAEPRSWEVVRLHEVAEAAGITLDELRVYFREKEDIVEAWFDRADAAMLHAAAAPGFLSLTTRRRLQRVIMAWLNALAPHRRVTRQMISGKFEPGHLHIQIPGIMRVSRTVQWFREAAHRDASYVQRAFEEVATTGIYLATFCYWMRDDSPGSGATETFLERLLGIAERFAHATVGSSAAVPSSGPEPPA